MLPNITNIKNYLLQLQSKLCQTLENIDGQAKFLRDHWSKENKGEGGTYVLSEGAVIEKCGVNFSHVFGQNLPPAASVRHPELAGQPFEVVGVSAIIHPRNPYAPTAHFNLRFFLSQSADQTPVWWFGGGYDLTPYYGFEEDCYHFHQTAKKACDPFGEDLYPTFKQAADTYFYLKHRQESRGIGGIFFDDFPASHADDQSWNFERAYAFAESVGNSFMPAYIPILERRMTQPYEPKAREFQLYRRGRYVEFNLIYDRGTLFGLQFGGRTESILISLPPEVRWAYDWQPEPNTPEARLYSDFLVPRDWILNVPSPI